MAARGAELAGDVGVLPAVAEAGSCVAAKDVSNVVGANGDQGIHAGDMGRVVRAIRDGAAYGNVHSTMFKAGETRGQLVRSDN